MRPLTIKRKEIPPLTRMAAGGFTLAGVLAVGSLAFVTRPLGLFVLLGGAVLVAIASTVMWHSKRQVAAKKAARFSGTLAGAIKSDRGEGMSRQDLLDAINEGLDTIKSARKSIYFRPWYLVVGPAGVGKTEAIRNSGVDLPKLRKDPLQGLGGTRTMHWWFANDAVIIDTAGRLFDAPDDSPLVERWNEFLKMLRNARKECPVNGLIVVVSAEDLLRDDWKAHASEKAPHFARQLERIQRSLGRLRFPVYLMVTKCDLVPGFQAFMREIGNRDLQQQIFGWSKPGEPDEPMSADDAARGLEEFIDRIRRRRDLILPHTTGNLEADPWKNMRLDRVDELFVFPNEFARLIEPIRTYMEGMLSQDAWSSGQLYFRGVYFSTSLQDGRVLDKALARATGRDLNDLPKVETEESKPYFLRDLFTEKIFCEQGLVSEADSLSKQRKRRAALVLSTAAALLALLGVLVFTGATRFNKTVGRHADAWASIASDVERDGPVNASFISDAASQRVVRLDAIQRVPASQKLLSVSGNAESGSDESLRPIAPILASAAWSAQPITVPWEFAWIGPIFGNWGSDLLAKERQAAHRALVEGRVLVPMIHAAYRRASDYAALDTSTPIAAAEREKDERAIAALLALHTLAGDFTPSGLTTGTDPGAFAQRQIVLPLFALVEPMSDGPADASEEANAWEHRIEPALRHIAADALTEPGSLSLLDAASPIRHALAADATAAGRMTITPRGETVPIENTIILRAIEHLPAVHQLPGAYDDPLVMLAQLSDSLKRYSNEEHAAINELSNAQAKTAADYAALAQRWKDASERVNAAASRVVNAGSPAGTWNALPEELRAALLMRQSTRISAMLDGLSTVRQDGYQRSRQMLRDSAPPVGASPAISTSPDPATIASRAASAIQSLPALNDAGPASASAASFDSPWERALLAASDSDPNALRLSSRAEAFTAIHQAMLAVPDYDTITAAISRPAWFTLPLSAASTPPPLAAVLASRSLGSENAELADLSAPIRASLQLRQAWQNTHHAANLVAGIIGRDDPAPTDRAINLALRKAIESASNSAQPDAAIAACLGLNASDLETARQRDARAIAALSSQIKAALTALDQSSNLDQPTRDTLARLAHRLDAAAAESSTFWLALPDRLTSQAGAGVFAPLAQAEDWPSLHAALRSLPQSPSPAAGYQQSVAALLGLSDPEALAAYSALSPDPAWRNWLQAMDPARDAWSAAFDRLLAELAAASSPADAAEALARDNSPLLAVPTSRALIEAMGRAVAADPAGP